MDEQELKRNRGAVLVVLVDNNVSVATTLCGGFRVLGYGDVKLMRDVEALEAALHGPGFDLIIGDADIQDGALLNLVRRLRNGDIGRNPFTAVIVTTWNKDWTIVRSAIDAGVDDILVNPISPGRLSERIQTIVERRKPFIVTADYTGPERRRDPNRVSTIPAFFPPNSLAEKERGRFVDEADLKWRIDHSAREIAAEKLRRSVFQLAFLQGLADIAVNRDNAAASATGYLGQLRAQAKSTMELVRATGQPELGVHVSELTRVVAEMIKTAPMQTGLVAARREVDKLLSKIFTEETVTATRTDVNLAIRAYEQRRQAQLAAAD
jgi:DNA-binding response OmpR family regulator